jgi:hypothetical protein
MFNDHASITKILPKFSALLIIFTILGCAVGDPFDLSKDKIPTLKPDMARIFVYRSFNPLAMLRPINFKLDGKNIAESYASTIFYYDVTPGKHLVNMGTAADELSLNVLAGKTVFLRYSIVSDAISKANYIIELIDNKTAENDLKNVRLIKTELRFPDEAK